eukprot:3381191-Amphidinium_carterae.1
MNPRWIFEVRSACKSWGAVDAGGVICAVHDNGLSQVHASIRLVVIVTALRVRQAKFVRQYSQAASAKPHVRLGTALSI